MGGSCWHLFSICVTSIGQVLFKNTYILLQHTQLHMSQVLLSSFCTVTICKTTLVAQDGLVPLCAGCPSAGEPQTRHSTPAAISQVLNRKEQLFPLTCWLLWFWHPVYSWLSVQHGWYCWFIFSLPTRIHTSFYAMLLPHLSWFLGILHLKVQDFAFALADVHEVLVNLLEVPLKSSLPFGTSATVPTQVSSWFCKESPVPSSWSLSH